MEALSTVRLRPECLTTLPAGLTRSAGIGLSATYDYVRFIRMEKLTLSVDRHVVARAKAYARARGTSVSRLVETMLDLAARGEAARPEVREAAPPPVLGRLRGSLSRGTVADYERHLARKYR